jgi:hypothetical protein
MTRLHFPLFVALSSLLVWSSTSQAALVFQADFNGSGSGTGGVSDIVQAGGSGVIYSQSGSNATSSVSSTSPLSGGSGGYLSIGDAGVNTTNGTGAGVTFSPASVGNSFDSWLTQNGVSAGVDSLTGGFDFFFRMDSMSGTWNSNSLRFLDISGGTNGLRLVLNNNSTNRLQLELINVSNSSLNVTANNPSSSPIAFTEGTLYHVAGTVATNSSTGRVTLSLYLAEGNTAIDTSSSTYRIGQATSSGSYDVTQAFNSVNGFNFGLVNNNVSDIKSMGIDSFRIYDSVPATFSTLPIPEPASLGVILMSGTLFLVRRRRTSSVF